MRCLLFAIMLLLNISNALPQREYRGYPNTIYLEAAELLVTYSLSYQQDSLDPYDIRQENMLLFLGGNVSCFLSMRYLRHIEQQKSLTSRAEMLEVIQNPDFQLPVTRFRYQIFKRGSKN